MKKQVDILASNAYNSNVKINRNSSGQGDAAYLYCSRFPTDGIVRELLLAAEPVRFRYRQYSLDERRNDVFADDGRHMFA